ncbi:MAG: alpha/beta hydrolase [Sphingomonas taxi]|uniref:Alpha/beta hydrolase n=1 Tax=Sphingomonas taxi TaxID=1549858 RepID=A0A2W5P403_9SPHN|nr:MAG: alpha/beta hydrolase [Sphingomonas taxi]
MQIDRRALMGGAAGLATLATAPRALAQEATTAWPPRDHFRLWPKQPPNSPRRLPTPDNRMNGTPPRRELHLRGVAEPIVAVYRPARPDGRALLAMPGGGYRFISVENEGINVARTFNPLGVTVFVLAYRLPGEGWLEPQDVPLQDAQRAMRLIRARASDFAIDAAKLGIVGFSAGGLLAASLAVAHADPVYDRVDAADDGSARPAFAGLIYPVISADVMRVGALGASRFDTDRRVRPDTPPVFIVHALDDPIVPAAQPLAMLAACQAARVPVEAHFLQEGGHGFGPAYLPDELPGSQWPQLFDRWMRRTSVSRTTG